MFYITELDNKPFLVAKTKDVVYLFDVRAKIYKYISSKVIEEIYNPGNIGLLDSWKKSIFCFRELFLNALGLGIYKEEEILNSIKYCYKIYSKSLYLKELYHLLNDITLKYKDLNGKEWFYIYLGSYMLFYHFWDCKDPKEKILDKRHLLDLEENEIVWNECVIPNMIPISNFKVILKEQNNE